MRVRPFLSPTLHAVAMMPDTGTGGAGGAPELAKVTLPGGAVVELPKAAAEAFHAAQQKHNAERDELARKVGAIDAERKAAEERAAAEARDKEALKLAKEGELAKARELFTAEANARAARLEAELKGLKQAQATAAIREAITAAARRLGVAETVIPDMLPLVAPRAAVADNGEVTFVDGAGAPSMKDGKPVGADAYLTDFLAARPHFQPASVPGSTGGTGTGAPVVAGTIRLADVPNITKEQAAAMAAGKLRVVE
jgi:hypothetical protein